MRGLHLRLSPALWSALEARRRETGEPLEHIVRSALAEHLGLGQHTLFQVSTSTALVEGIYRGAVTIGELRRHGDFGLGTFEGIDGEMVVVDGGFWQVRSDGTVHAAGDDASSPFAVVTHFRPARTRTLAAAPDLASLLAAFDALRDSANLFYALRVRGRFAHAHTRAMCRTAEGVSLAEAAAHQPEFHLRDVVGTAVGFWSPAYAKAFEVPGYHLHFITDEHTAGGHLLGAVAAGPLELAVQRLDDLRVALPANEAFLRADLSHDPAAALDAAEHAKPGR
ncbi:MAG: acetolactate decarboxylase [bacterium]|nr:acetolactate decarboxylase [bacterium]